MRTKTIISGLTAAAFIFLIVVASGVLVRAFLRHPPGGDSAAWAAWIQAFGSIGAIALAIALAFWQAWYTRQAARNSALERAVGIVRIVRTLTEALRKQLESMSSGTPSPLDNSVIRPYPAEEPFVELETAARAIPLLDLPDVAPVELTVGLLRLISTARETTRRIRMPTTPESRMFSTPQSPYSVSIQAADLLEKKCDAAMLRLRGCL